MLIKGVVISLFFHIIGKQFPIYLTDIYGFLYLLFFLQKNLNQLKSPFILGMDNLAFLVVGMIGYGAYNKISNRSSDQNGGKYDDFMDNIEVEDAEVLTNDQISMYLNISKQPMIDENQQNGS